LANTRAWLIVRGQYLPGFVGFAVAGGRCTCGRAGRSVARELDEDELIGNWTLVGDELEVDLPGPLAPRP